MLRLQSHQVYSPLQVKKKIFTPRHIMKLWNFMEENILKSSKATQQVILRVLLIKRDITKVILTSRSQWNNPFKILMTK